MPGKSDGDDPKTGPRTKGPRPAPKFQARNKEPKAPPASGQVGFDAFSPPPPRGDQTSSPPEPGSTSTDTTSTGAFEIRSEDLTEFAESPQSFERVEPIPVDETEDTQTAGDIPEFDDLLKETLPPFTSEIRGDDGAFYPGIGSRPANIFVTQNLSPRSSDIILYSSDAAFSLGPLQQYVLKELGITQSDTEVMFGDEGFQIYRTKRHILAAAVSIPRNPDLPRSDMLENNLNMLLRNLAQTVELKPNSNLWIPLMGTGSAGLSFVNSAQVIADVLAKLLNSEQFPNEITTIDISLPERITDQAKSKVLEIFERAFQETPDGQTSSDPDSEMPDQFHPDRPVSDTSGDDLGRDAIAAAIVTNVNNVWADHVAHNYPFAVHLSGEWGSGKSSILSFLEHRMAKPSEAAPQGWITVKYNAWQMEDAGPPWWSLLTSVSDQTYDALGAKGAVLRLRDTIWRTTRIARPWMMVVAVVLGLMALYLAVGSGDDITHTVTTETVQTIELDGQTTKITDREVDPIRKPDTFFGASNAWGFIAAAITALGSIGALLKFLSGFTKSSTETAEAVRNLQSDPTAVLKERYDKVIAQAGRPIAVFIDDLDRCKAPFVVDLLQSLQTAYADVPVLYVVASDRDWLVSAYNQVYTDFRPEIDRVGEPLGYLFVKKIFQLAVPVPRISPVMTETLTRALLDQNVKNKPETETRATRVTQVKAAAAQGRLEEIAQIQADALAEGQNITTEVMEAVSTSQAQAQAAHKLLSYTEHFDPTPRAIKRLINALTFRQGYILSAARNIDFDTITRWTILSLRYPYTADFLSMAPEKTLPANRSPEDAKYFPNPTDIDKILEGLSIEAVAEIAAFG